MQTHRLILDANLLVLFVVGRTSPHLIGKHRRVRAFSADDYELLIRVMGAAKQIVVTPNTLTETSNLLGDMHSTFSVELQNIIETAACGFLDEAAMKRSRSTVSKGISADASSQSAASVSPSLWNTGMREASTLATINSLLC